MKYTTTEKIKDILKNHSDREKNGGVDFLLASWKSFVCKVSDMEDIDDFMNNIMIRNSIQLIVDYILPSEKVSLLLELDKIDNFFIANTLELKNPFRIEDEEKKYIGEWFDFRAPKKIVDIENLLVK